MTSLLTHERAAGDDPPVPALELHAVVKRYDTGAAEVRALSGVSLAVAPGELVAVMAASRRREVHGDDLAAD
ncbi:MAG: hypothetical protein M3487_09270 [Actinomycetota bacterium]|nr:hypothetical protein [Actinomycetota bacterium]